MNLTANFKALLLLGFFGIMFFAPRRFRNRFVLTLYDCLFGWPWLIVHALWTRCNWHHLTVRGKFMWLGRVYEDKAENRLGQWIPCLMTQRFNYSALEYDGDPVEAECSPVVDREAITELEKAFAEHYRTEDAVIFVTGFVGNVECLTAIGSITPNVMFVWDSLCHKSLFEGFRHHRNQSFPHDDMKALEEILEKETPESNVWVITESPFSMEGDTPNTSELLRLRDKFGVRLLVDLAHSFGSEEEFSSFDVRITSLAKSSGLYGGLMVGPSSVATWIRENGKDERREYPKYSIQPLYRFLEALKDGTIAKRASKVRQLACFTHDALTADGWHVRSPRGAYILCIQIGTPFVVAAMQQYCMDHGIYFAMIGHPGIPWRCFLGFRVCITASWTHQDAERMVSVMREFVHPLKLFPMARAFVSPWTWSWNGPVVNETDLSKPPTYRWGVNAPRLLGGNTMNQLYLERKLAAKYEYDRCILMTDSEIGKQAWKKLIPTIKELGSIDEAQNASEDAVITPIKPFGAVFLCKDSIWKDEFWLKHKMIVFTMVVPSYVYAHMIA